MPAHSGECLIRVRMAGICGTDLQILEGYAEFEGIPGHEFVGVVEDAPSADAAWLGKRVAGEINIGCGACDWCARGVKEHCTTRTVVGIRGRGGAFAEHVALPAANLHEIPAGMNDRTAVFIEPVAAACRIFEQVPLSRHARVAIVGDGRMGLLVAQVMRTVAADVTVFGKHDHKLAIARGLGLQTTASAGASRNGTFDVVVDVTGRPDGMTKAIELAKPLGTVVLKSTFHGEAAVTSWPIVVHEKTLVGSRCGPFRPAIDLLASGAVQVEPLIARIARLEDHASAFADARRMMKVLFDVDGRSG
ncbi:MAG TPA: alcohol dehydrogenase catalytic domain-containing protein [Vicinamibacterales bacterium]|nr:alcohol dehydrogenase catalytic domain-containing protein [Vicinamibacterales bacterium]